MAKRTPEGTGGQREIAVESALEEVLREGARRMLQAAIEGEVADYVDSQVAVKDENGHRLVVRNRGEVHEQDSAAVHAAGSEHRRLDSVSVPEGDFHG